ncbi:MAG: hypothetical protein HZA19_01205 [Nitrospirae bacterium]|nr:hypothetical protein [Nitrospirota bacterium]
MKTVPIYLFLALFLGAVFFYLTHPTAYADAGHDVSGIKSSGSGSKMDSKEIHALMEKMMRDCGELNRNLQAMFAYYEKNGKQETPAVVKEHETQMKQLLHQMQSHMEDEVRMLEEVKALGVGHEEHHR